ncbi:disintegrin and metalloproteinase domain-containing protein 17-like isoform X2 [Physella acuta]|nr:disintegrin and metalloproteinase domain-containing protein 17-like isoform X2 [Physella acuta]
MAPMCGNGVLDEPEECDSGGLVDPCCSSTCRFLGNATCSRSNSDCCTNCTMATKGLKCRPINDDLCSQAAYCDGRSLECPPSPPIADNVTHCLDDGRCIAGRCLSYCERQHINLKPCRCMTPGHECLRCCQSPDGVCKSYGDGKDVVTDGRPCSYGYCQTGVCMKSSIDLIHRLFSAIENLDSSTLKKLIKSNIVGFVLVITLIFWIPASCTVSYIDKRQIRRFRSLRAPRTKSIVPVKQLSNYTIKRSLKRRSTPIGTTQTLVTGVQGSAKGLIMRTNTANVHVQMRRPKSTANVQPKLYKPKSSVMGSLVYSPVSDVTAAEAALYSPSTSLPVASSPVSADNETTPLCSSTPCVPVTSSPLDTHASAAHVTTPLFSPGGGVSKPGLPVYSPASVVTVDLTTYYPPEHKTTTKYTFKTQQDETSM